jgi:ABC-type Fe3+-hydroxamate transport system substrate-binding protein
MTMLARFGSIVAVTALVATAGCASTAPENNRLYGTSPSNTVGTPRAATYEGTVTRVDAPQRVIVMSDGRMYQVPANSTVYVNGQPVGYATVQPGTHVVVPNGQLVELRDGRYALVQQPGAVAVSGYRQTVQGTVVDVDRNEVKIRTPNDSFEVPMQGAEASGIRKGDTVTIDLMFTPAAPAALPR